MPYYFECYGCGVTTPFEPSGDLTLDQSCDECGQDSCTDCINIFNGTKMCDQCYIRAVDAEEAKIPIDKQLSEV